MKTINIREAKTHLSQLVEEAASGKPFVIAKAGKPLVKSDCAGFANRETDAEAWVPAMAHLCSEGF